MFFLNTWNIYKEFFELFQGTDYQCICGPLASRTYLCIQGIWWPHKSQFQLCIPNTSCCSSRCWVYFCCSRRCCFGSRFSVLSSPLSVVWFVLCVGLLWLAWACAACNIGWADSPPPPVSAQHPIPRSPCCHSRFTGLKDAEGEQLQLKPVFHSPLLSSRTE